jgi:hypothetical protein
MNLGFNVSQIANPYMGGGMMYGGNFVDVLFRHLMEHGWEGFTLMAVLNFYMYLSLDRIKDLFKYANDKIAEHGKQHVEYYCGLVAEKTKVWPKTIFNKARSMEFRKKKVIVEQPEIKPQFNKSTITLNSSNKTDLMALGNFILKNKKHIKLTNYYRENSDKYKTTEVYILPSSILFDRTILNSIAEIKLEDEDISIQMNQNVDATLVCESDGKIEVLKDVRIKVPEGIVKVDWREFHGLSSQLSCPLGGFPGFSAKSLDGYNSSPGNFCNSRCYHILFYIYYTKNFTLLRNFLRFLMNGDTFDFMGKKYRTTNCDDYPSDLKDNSQMLSSYLTELEKYIDNDLMKYITDRDKKDDVEKWVSGIKHHFNPVSNNTPAISINFESPKVLPNELSLFSRKFMRDLITDYYNQKIDNIGSKISIYQLHIKYNVEIQRKENPEHAKWCLKYGKKEGEESDKKSDSDKKDSDKKDSSDKKKKDSSKGGAAKSSSPGKSSEDKDTDSTNTKKREQSKDDEEYDDEIPDYYDFPYGFPRGRGRRHPVTPYKYVPPEPNKFVEEEISIPVAETKHIKSDKKPMAYLYLQKMDKSILVSYLSNFKNNQEMYNKMGIPYKGGIMLSGDPGCGKSSTILAIATDLNKDIFYLDLGKIKTNHELKLCVDYVKTNSQKGGIIIFEDVDCMTDIVKRRSNDSETPTRETVSKNMDLQNDALSLSFLLNVLDGTMAPENVIFIMTTNHKEILDPALIRPGRMDISIGIKKCDKYQVQQIYFDLFGKQIKQETLNRFREFEFITSEVILHLFHNIYNVSMDDDKLLEKFLVPIDTNLNKQIDINLNKQLDTNLNKQIDINLNKQLDINLNKQLDINLNKQLDINLNKQNVV